MSNKTLSKDQAVYTWNLLHKKMMKAGGDDFLIVKPSGAIFSPFMFLGGAPSQAEAEEMLIGAGFFYAGEAKDGGARYVCKRPVKGYKI